MRVKGMILLLTAALAAVLLQILSHALTKPMLFLSGSQLMAASGGHQDFHSLRSAGHRDPVAGVVFTIGSLSMVGIPLFAGFIPKLYFALASFQMGWRTWAVLAALAISTLLNVLYFLYTAMVLWLPQKENALHHVHQRSWYKAIPAVLLLAIGLAIGIHSAPLTALLQQGFALFCQY